MQARRSRGCSKHADAKTALSLAACAVVLLASGSANAQDAQSAAAAETLFTDARKLMLAGDLARACPKLEESERLAPAVGTLLNLGICYEKTQRNASAWATFKEAVSAARARGQTEREQLAGAKAHALEGKFSTLSIRLPSELRDADGLTVRRDGVVVERAAWDSAMPLDSGAHRIEVSATSRRPWSTTVNLSDDGKPQTVDVPALAVVAAPKVAPRTAVVDAPPVSASTPPSSTQRTVALVVAGLGLASVATGTVFGAIAKSKNDDALANHCGGGSFCDAEGLALTNEARTSATVATVSIAAGGVALVTGAVLFFTAPKHGATRGSVQASPTLTAHSAGFSFGGSW